mmetsp:Transcript_22848/g.41137  ORF Transcript_22848/g.41137 Transcript_22848/m.41137 type:complete len:240 (+) Transcript_22848:1442-2161(+)
MDFCIGRCCELFCQDGILVGCHDLICFGNRPLHSSGSRGEYDFSPKCLQQRSPLDGHALRHAKHHFVPLHGSHSGQTNPRVPACGLHQHTPARRNLPLLLQIPDHSKCKPILDAAHGVQILQLDSHLSNAILRDLVKVHQWSVSHQRHHVISNVPRAHGCSSALLGACSILRPQFTSTALEVGWFKDLLAVNLWTCGRRGAQATRGVQGDRCRLLKAVDGSDISQGGGDDIRRYGPNIC